MLSAWLVPVGRRGNIGRSRECESSKGEGGELKEWLVVTSLSANKRKTKAEISVTWMSGYEGT